MVEAGRPGRCESAGRGRLHPDVLPGRTVARLLRGGRPAEAAGDRRGIRRARRGGSTRQQPTGSGLARGRDHHLRGQELQPLADFGGRRRVAAVGHGGRRGPAAEGGGAPGGRCGARRRLQPRRRSAVRVPAGQTGAVAGGPGDGHRAPAARRRRRCLARPRRPHRLHGRHRRRVRSPARPRCRGARTACPSHGRSRRVGQCFGDAGLQGRDAPVPQGRERGDDGLLATGLGEPVGGS